MASDGLSTLLTGESARPWSVNELNSLARISIESEFGNVWVEGEVVSFVAHGSGHWYFNLKDSDSSIKCVVWRSTNNRLRFKPENGNVIRIRGNLTIWETAGVFQLNVRSIEPAGEGAILAAIAQIRAKLSAEGLFDPELKRPLPFFPRKIGIVTARGGAAIGDISSVLRRRARSVDIVFAPAAVQGEGAAASVIRSIRSLERYNDERDPAERIDVVIVGRGGGSAEDLWAFNDEDLARAIRNCSIPVISAVGHEIDHSISDDVADLRAGTPSIAAEMVVAREDDILAFMDRASLRISELVNRMVADTLTDIDRAATSMTDAIEERIHLAEATIRNATVILRPATLRSLAESISVRLSAADAAIERAMSRRLAVDIDSVNIAVAKLDALSPLGVLSRGYSITQSRYGRIIQSADQVSVGDDISIRLSSGRLDARVQNVEQ